jgi:sialate O-acetylesterase
MSTLPIAREFKLVYELDLSKLGRDIKYDVDNSSQIQAFDRVGYLLELTTPGGEQQNVFVSMNAFSDDVKKIAIPTVASQATFQQPVAAMDVFSNVKEITTGTNIETGNIEFWPNNYGPANAGNVSGASATDFDFGDEMDRLIDGYGSMQVHNSAAGRTLFAVNHWNAGATADIGIGNSTGQTRDWTFKGNAGSYSSKRLRVYVRVKPIKL